MRTTRPRDRHRVRAWLENDAAELDKDRGFHTGHGLTSKEAQGVGGYLNPRYPKTKRTMTIAPTHQMMLFIACSYVGDGVYRWNARPRDRLGERVFTAVPRGATGAGYDRSGERSGEQHGESRAVAALAAIDPQFAADLRGEGGDQLHSQAFAGGGIETFRQGGAVVAHRQGMALS